MFSVKIFPGIFCVFMSTVYLLYIQYKLFIYSCQGGIGSFVYMHNKFMYYLGAFVII